MSHVFISHSTRNGEYPHRLADELRSRGFNVWISNSSIRVSEDWWGAIKQALQSSSVVIVIMTPESQQSRWVQREIGIAEELDKPIVPILLGGNRWEMFVRQQYEDVRVEDDLAPNYKGKLPSQQFFEVLRDLMNSSTNHGADIATEVFQKLIDREADNANIHSVVAPPRTSGRSNHRFGFILGCGSTVVLLVVTLSVLQLMSVSGVLPFRFGETHFVVVDEFEQLGSVFTMTTNGVDNRNSENSLSEELEIVREFRHVMDFDYTPTGRGSGISRQTFEDRLLDTYSIPDKSGTKMCLVPADVPSGNVYAYEIEWTEITRRGTIYEDNGVRGDILARYNMVVDLQCQVVGVVVLQ